MASLLKPVPMARVAVVGLKKYRQEVISILHDMNVVQLEPLSKDAASLLKSERESDLHREVSDQLLRVKGLRNALPQVKLADKVKFQSADEVLQKVKSLDIDKQVASLERQKENLITKTKETENNIKLLEEFSFFPEDLIILQLSTARSFLGRIDTEKYAQFRKALSAESSDAVVYSKDGPKTTLMVLVVPAKFPSHTLAGIVQSNGAHLEPVPQLKGKPVDLVQSQKQSLSQMNAEMAKIDQELASISAKHYQLLVGAEEQLEIENKKLEVVEGFGSTKDAFALEGWVPKTSLEPIRASFAKHTKGTMLYELETNEHPPTMLQNPKRFKVFEAFVRFYSLPEGKEFDPTLIFGLIFPAFYGLMLGDVGYGVVILLVSRWVIRRVEGGKKNFNIMPRPLAKFAKSILKPSQMVKLAKAMTPGAIIAIILGFFFNLYFGFHINQYLFGYLNANYGFHLPENGAFLDPIDTFGLRKLLLFSGYIGIGMVSFGLILGILNSMREHEKKHVISKVGWLLFGWGIVLLGLALLHHQHVNPVRHIEGVGYFALILAGIGLMFYGEGTRSIMELPSIISHILSYTRIVGILLASVILADVIDFIFIKTLHHNIPFIILGVIIFFVGHIFNIILGVFEPGIQGARLIYVEFFSKFYHGNGRKFIPFGSARRFTYHQYRVEE